jgi:hypothetical protein
MNRFVVMAAAWLEIIIGASLLVMANLACRLLFGTLPVGLAVPEAHFAGIGLVGLGIACLPSKVPGPDRSPVLGLLVFNVGAAVFLAWVGIATAYRGVLLWPAVVLHAAISIGLLLNLLAPNHRNS